VVLPLVERLRVFNRLLISLSFMILYTSLGNGFRQGSVFAEVPELKDAPELEEVFRQESMCVLMSFPSNSFWHTGHCTRFWGVVDFRALLVFTGEFINLSWFTCGRLVVSSFSTVSLCSEWLIFSPVISACKGLKQSMISPRMRLGLNTPVETSALHTGHLFRSVTYFRIQSEQTKNRNKII